MKLYKNETIEIISLIPNNTIRQAMSAIDLGAVGLALIVDPDDSSFIGVLTDGDLRRGILSGLTLEDEVSRIARPESSVASIYDPPAKVTAMLTEKVRAIPLIDDRQRVVDIAFYDQRVRIPVSEPSIGENELRYVTECILTNWVSSAGKFVDEFEQMFSEFCGAEYAIATSNGTAALHLSLLALGIGPGDEVIVPSLTFIATANSVRYTGAKPVFIDSNWETWNMDHEQLESIISASTKAIIPVHLYGHPVDMDPVLEIAREHDLFIVEDAAEAHGAQYKNRPVGTFGNLGCFSFYGNKIITTGEGGMVVTNDEKLADQVRRLRDHGMDPARRYWHTLVGYNYRLTNLQAALGVAQLERIDQILKRKIEIANLYIDSLSGISDIIDYQREASWAKSVYWLFTIYLKDGANQISRDELMEVLLERGVESRPVFIPMHKQPIYSSEVELPVSEYISDHGISLPSSVNLLDDDVRRISTELMSIFKKEL